MRYQHLLSIESKMNDQEDMISELNQLANEQQKQIEELEQTCKTLINRTSKLAQCRKDRSAD